MLVQYSSTEQKRIRNRKQHKLCSGEGCTNQTMNGAVCRYCKPKKGGSLNPENLSFSTELANKGGRIGIYSPEERKARIARFHAKRSSRVSSDESAMT